MDKQRFLINHFKLAVELGAEVVKVDSDNVAKAIVDEAKRLNITTICIGKPTFHFIKLIFGRNFLLDLFKEISNVNIDLVILSQ